MEDDFLVGVACSVVERDLAAARELELVRQQCCMILFTRLQNKLT